MTRRRLKEICALTTDLVAADVRRLKQKTATENKASVVVVSRDWTRV